jgi:hypothetical protein
MNKKLKWKNKKKLWNYKNIMSKSINLIIELERIKINLFLWKFHGKIMVEILILTFLEVHYKINYFLKTIKVFKIFNIIIFVNFY